MKQTSALRKVGQWGKSCGVRLSPEAQRALGVTAGGGLYEVLTDDRTVELQPLAPPAPGARRRRYLSNRVRNLERERKQLHAKRHEAYQAGYAEGFMHGYAKAWGERFLRWDQTMRKLERLLDAGEPGPALEPSRGVLALAGSLGRTGGALRGIRSGNTQNKTPRGATGGNRGDENTGGPRGSRAREHGKRTTR